MEYTGSDDQLLKLYENGVSDKILQHDTIRVKCITITGEQRDSVFNFNSEIMESTNPMLPVGLSFFGMSIAGIIEVDSVSAPEVYSTQSQSLPTMARSLLQQGEPPAGTLRVGDSLRHTFPMNVPAGGIQVKIEIITTYFLRQIMDGTGYIDFNVDYKINSGSVENAPLMHANGKGKLEYDIRNKCLTEFHSEVRMNTYSNQGSSATILTISTISDQNTLVEKLK